VKLLNKIAIFAFACLAVPACSGGGPAHPQINATPTPSPTPSPTGSGAVPTPSPTSSSSIANTSVPGYLPFGSGDKWTFSGTSGAATITDEGSSTLTGCACAADGTTIERMDLASGGTYTGSLIYAKGTWALSPYTGHALTYLVGISENEGSTIELFYYSNDGTVPGIPAIDDAPSAGEAFTLPPPAGVGGGSLSITAVGQTQALGAQTIINVAQTTLIAGANTTYFSYAPGVGFTYVELAAGPMTLTSFSLSGASGSVMRGAAHGQAWAPHVAQVHANSHALSAMLEAWAGRH